jgi:5-methyltetrahydrofolate--homocysteine methyltransferase
MMGVHPRTVGTWAAATSRLSGVGANCGIGPEDIVAAVAGIRETAPEVITVAKGNCGVPLYSGLTMTYPTTLEDMDAYVDRAVAAGVRIIGACCGSTPQHIARIRNRVDAIAAGVVDPSSSSATVPATEPNEPRSAPVRRRGRGR